MLPDKVEEPDTQEGLPAGIQWRMDNIMLPATEELVLAEGLPAAAAPQQQLALPWLPSAHKRKRKAQEMVERAPAQRRLAAAKEERLAVPHRQQLALTWLPGTKDVDPADRLPAAAAPQQQLALPWLPYAHKRQPKAQEVVERAPAERRLAAAKEERLAPTAWLPAIEGVAAAKEPKQFKPRPQARAQHDLLPAAHRPRTPDIGDRRPRRAQVTVGVFPGYYYVRMLFRAH